jgi:very-short-patch-repair endonuclease
VNVEVFDSRGRFIARVDLCYPHLKLSIEYQGDQHRTDRAQRQRDLRRTRALQAEGWTELQYSQDDLDDPERFLAELRTVIARLSH